MRKSTLKATNRWMVITDWQEVGNGKYDMKHVPWDGKAGMGKEGCFCAERGLIVTFEVMISLVDVNFI